VLTPGINLAAIGNQGSGGGFTSADRAVLDGIAAELSIGNGQIPVTITVEDTAGNPLPNVEVWVASDQAGADIVAGPMLTSQQGVAQFMLEAGTWYVWRQGAGERFTNPQAIVVGG